MDKSVNHILTHCGRAFRLWSLIFNFVWCFLGSSPFDKKNCCWDVIVPRGTRKASLLLMLDNLEEKIKMKGTSKVVDQSQLLEVSLLKFCHSGLNVCFLLDFVDSQGSTQPGYSFWSLSLPVFSWFVIVLVYCLCTRKCLFFLLDVLLINFIFAHQQKLYIYIYSLAFYCFSF